MITNFKLKFSKVYDNNIFTINHKKPVVEDYFRIKDNLFCLADGVTRDSIEGKAIPYPKDKKEVEEWLSVYPNPSGAYEAAKICANQFVHILANYKESQINEQAIQDIVKIVNQQIGKINEGRKIDYLKEDLYCCVAVGGIIIGDTLYCFSIGDSHIIVLDKTADVIFQTNNNHKAFEDYLDNIYSKEHEFDWDNDNCRVMVRKKYRNKPKEQYHGQEVSFGVLSGEKEAEHYIEVNKVDLKRAKYVCAYSDGCEPYFATQEKRMAIMKEPELIAQEGKERTLIIYEK